MLYYLFQYLEKFDFPGAGMFGYVSFRSLMAIILSLLISAIFGEYFINLLKRKQITETQRDASIDPFNVKKVGVPTMGGIIIIVAILIPCLLLGKLHNIYMILMLITTIWLGTLGFLDDYIKVFRKDKEGLHGKFKIIGQVGLGLIVGLTLYLSPSVVIRENVEIQRGGEIVEVVHKEQDQKSTKTTIPFFKNNNLDYADFVGFLGDNAQAVGWIIFVLVTIFVVTAVSNGANLNDGMDGMAAGNSAIIGLTLGILAYVSSHIEYAGYLNIMYIPGSEELVIFICSFIGALIGFLWYNAFPAQVFMGDTGSLTIGGIIAVFAIIIHKELLIPILCGIFLVENLSVILQVRYFKSGKKKGHNITFRGSFGYGDNDNDQYTQSETRYYQIHNYLGGDSIQYRNQYITMPTKNYNYTAQLTYSEPIARATFLQFSYRFQYKNTTSDKSTYDLQGFPWEIGDGLPEGYEAAYVDSLSKDAEYKYFNHDVSLGLRFIREKYQMSVGMSLQPQNTKLSYKKGAYMVDTTRTVFNFAPNLDFRYRFSKVSQLRITYRGRSSQPSMENLLPIVDNSNPLNIRVGNPGLKPSFAHTMRAFYNTYNAERQRGMVAHLMFTATQNSISNSTQYDMETGRTIVTPQNINGNWNAFGMFGFNTALKNKKFTINSFARANYQNQVAYLYNKDTKMDDKNTTTGLTLAENLNGSYRNDWFEFSLNGSIEYTAERSKLRPENNQNPYTFSYGASTNVTLPWQMTLSTNITNQSRRGYNDASYNNNELIWNAQIAQNLLKGAATISFEMYDILKQQSNISRSLSADMRSVTEYNSINSYCMLHFIYRLNIFGSKGARDKMMNSRRGFGGPGIRGVLSTSSNSCTICNVPCLYFWKWGVWIWLL